jgi:glycosyltransferase involved in cell wall biosynthesis
MNEFPYKKISVSVVLPTKNEEKNVAGVCENLVALKRDEDKYGIKLVEAIFVLNNTEDDTELVLNKIKERRGYEFVTVSHSKGARGSAMRKGAELAKGDILVFMDSDGEYDPRLIPWLVRPVIEGECDVSGAMDKDNRNFIRYLFSTGFSKITSGLGVEYAQAGFKAARKKVALETIPDDVPGLDIDIRWMDNVVRKGYKFKSIVPVELQKRKYGKTSFNPFVLAAGLLYTATSLYLNRKIGKELPFPKILKKYMLYSSE